MKTWKHTTACGILVLGAPMLAASAQGADAPLSRDALFDLEPAKEKAVTSPPDKAAEMPASKDALFDLPPQSGQATAPAKAEAKEAPFADIPAAPKEDKQAAGWHGFFQGELARTYANPEHWSKMVGRMELGTSGRLDNGMQYKISGRLDYNVVYDVNDFYAPAVRDDQRAEFHLRENYLDFSSGDWEFRLGRQHIVWGEMVGLFVADVVSAKDLRDFILPDFQVLRIPQWAARAEYYINDFHTELIWIPFPSYDRIGKQGADFYPYPPALAPVILGEEKPGYRLSNGNFGLRLSQLTHGWDLSGFLYRSTDSQQTFYRDSVNPNQFTPRHDRIWQAGGTLAKDLGAFVLKGEAVYTNGRKYNLLASLVDADGLAPQNTLDWALGLDFNPNTETRLNAQIYQRVYFNHHPDIIPDKYENAYSLLVNYKLPNNWEAEALWVSSLNRDDWMLRPKLTWGFERNWRLAFGLDLFYGPATGIFGQYNKNDRAYAELRYDF